MACRGWFKMLTKTFTIGAVIIDFLFIYIQGFLFFIYRNRNKILFGLYCCDFFAVCHAVFKSAMSVAK